jgi:Flavocytochrome c sulphide dehydrogenase, flavin-binding
VHVYRVEEGKLIYVKDAGGISAIDTPALATTRKLEAHYAIGWLKNIMADAFA